MSEECFTDRPLPRRLLSGAVGLVLFSMVLALTSRMTGVGTTQLPPSQVVVSRALHFEDQSDGGITVRDDRDDAVVTVVQPGTNGFMRSVMRGMARERLRRGVGAEVPFRLTRWADGRLSLEDPVSGRSIPLEAFGPTNAQAFALLLQGPELAAR